MRERPIGRLSRFVAGSLSCVALLWGCADAPTPIPLQERGSAIPPIQPSASPAPVQTDPADTDLQVLRTASVARLNPDQGLDARNVGERVRWAGAVQQINASDSGVCLMILYAPSGGSGEPLWTNTPTYQGFEACTAGFYDAALVYESANVTVLGRIVGRTEKGMGGGHRPGPVVQIERLFRWSDCLEGDTTPGCVAGFLTPQTDGHN